MKITKFVHSCLLVEMPEPVNRTVLFDPGVYSESALDVGKLEFLDDIIITHAHSDHFSVPLIKQLVGKFPDVRITAPSEVVTMLLSEGLTATDQPSPGISFFDAPHEAVAPFLNSEPPEEIGVHYLDMFSHPGDSHSFDETKAILALPVQAPWGSTNDAVKLALALKPQHVLPIHDWHWSDQARHALYALLEKRLTGEGIAFHKLETGQPVVIDIGA
jgi:L-ascorbate metabolism protein UlaG (beta-lactamase superfamily)